VKLVWVADTDYTHTLCKQLPESKNSQKMAWIACAYSTAQGYKKFWKARIVGTGELSMFDTEQQAKDWAQAVVLLNQ
jgi:hypothetical protein